MKENNKIIIEWLGADKGTYNDYDLWGLPILNSLFEDIDTEDMDAKHFFKPEEMLFHKSWDWLMPCLIQIKNEKKWSSVRLAEYCGDILDLEKVYKFVITYISDYLFDGDVVRLDETGNQPIANLELIDEGSSRRFKLIASINVYDPEGNLQEMTTYWDYVVGAPFSLDNPYIDQLDSFHHPYTGEEIIFDNYKAF